MSGAGSNGSRDLADVERDELESYTRSLESRVDDLKRQTKILETRIDALSNRFEQFVNVVLGDRELGEAYDAGDESLISRTQNAHALAESALGLAKATGSSSDPTTKKAFARRLTLFALSKRHYCRSDMGNGAIDTTSLKDMAEAHAVDLASRTVLDAWDELVDEWTCFERETVTSDAFGTKERIQLDSQADEIPAPILRIVADDDLSSDDLAETLISRVDGTGGS